MLPCAAACNPDRMQEQARRRALRLMCCDECTRLPMTPTAS